MTGINRAGNPGLSLLPRIAGTGKTLIAFGDSKLANGDSFGYLYPTPTNLGTTYVVLKNASQNTPAGNATLEFRAADHAFRYTAPTDTAGPWTVLPLGVSTIVSGTAAYTLPIGVKVYPVADTTDTLARGAWQWIRNTGAVMYALEALLGRRVTILPNQAIPGAFALSAPGEWYAAAIASGADGIIDNPGTNDVSLGGSTAAQIIAARRACWAQAYAAGKPVFTLLIDPRWGLDPAGGATADSALYTSAFQATITAVNSGLIAEAKHWPNVYIADNWSAIVDPTLTQGRAQNGVMVDGLHYWGAAAIRAAVALAKPINTKWPNDSAPVNIGAGSYYSATDPRGNLLPSNQGAFAGTGGSVGTAGAATPAWVTLTAYTVNSATGWVINAGNLYQALTSGTSGATAPTHTDGTVIDGSVTWLFISSGVVSGLAANYTLTRSGTIFALCHKVTPTDGSPTYQELIVFGATATSDQLLLSGGAITMANVATGDILDYQYETVPMDAGCFGLGCDLFLSGPALSVQAFQCRSVVQGIAPGLTLTIGTQPYVLQSTVTGVNARHYINSVVGGIFRVRMRNADLHKIV